MTIAVFKQLPSIDHVKSEGEVVGWVKYVSTKCEYYMIIIVNGVIHKSIFQWSYMRSTMNDELYRARSERMEPKARMDFEARIAQMQAVIDYEETVFKTKPQLFIAA